MFWLSALTWLSSESPATAGASCHFFLRPAWEMTSTISWVEILWTWQAWHGLVPLTWIQLEQGITSWLLGGITSKHFCSYCAHVCEGVLSTFSSQYFLKIWFEDLNPGLDWSMKQSATSSLAGSRYKGPSGAIDFAPGVLRKCQVFGWGGGASLSTMQTGLWRSNMNKGASNQRFKDEQTLTNHCLTIFMWDTTKPCSWFLIDTGSIPWWTKTTASSIIKRFQSASDTYNLGTNNNPVIMMTMVETSQW